MGKKHIHIQRVSMCEMCACVCVCYYIAFAFAITPCYFVVFYTDFFVAAAAARTRHRLDVKICQKTAQNLRSFWFVCVHVVCVCVCV